jgi:hypothetical protein
MGLAKWLSVASLTFLVFWAVSGPFSSRRAIDPAELKQAVTQQQLDLERLEKALAEAKGGGGVDVKALLPRLFAARIRRDDQDAVILATQTPTRKLDTVRVAIALVVSLIVLGGSLYVILSKSYGVADQRWAYGAVGTLLGFWLHL